MVNNLFSFPPRSGGLENNTKKQLEAEFDIEPNQ